MKICNQNIGFKGTYGIDFAENTNKINETYALSSQFKNVELYTDFSTLSGKVNCVTPDAINGDVETYLNTQGIKFKKYDNEEIYGHNNIKARMVLPQGLDPKKYALVTLSTNKVQNYYPDDVPDNSLRKAKREEIKSMQKMEAPILYLTDATGELEAVFGDGRETYAVLRDMGMKDIPFAMEKDSIELAKKHKFLSHGG